MADATKDIYGSWVSNSSFGRIRLHATIDAYIYSDRVDFYLGIRLNAEYAISDTSNLFSISGDWSRSASSISVSTPSGGGTDTLWSEAVSSGHLYRVYGSPGQTVTASVSSYIDNLYEYNNKASVSGSLSVTIPAVVPTMGTTTISAGTNLHSVYIDWSVSNSGGASVDKYHLYRDGVFYLETTAGAYTDDIGYGASHTYKVYAHNSAGWSAASNTVTGTTPGFPSAPQDFTSDASTFGQIALSWSAPASNGGAGVVGYRLRRGTTVIYSGTGTSFTDTTVAPYTNYTYTVAAITAVTNETSTYVYNSLDATSLGGIAHVWNGSTQVTVLPKVWNGTTWLDSQARMWNGTEWKHGI